jgi:hypothetical protein
MMDMKQADYLSAGTANWQHGIGILVQSSNNKVTPYAVPIINGEINLP